MKKETEVKALVNLLKIKSEGSDADEDIWTDLTGWDGRQWIRALEWVLK